MTGRARLRGKGHLVIIGGHEDRRGDMDILRHFVELSGGVSGTIAVVTAASRVPEAVWPSYEGAFGELGVKACHHIGVSSREEANDPARVELLAGAGGIFMTGGDQKRLLALLGGSALEREVRAALRERGACIAGTSAGASAMSMHMLADGETGDQPVKGSVVLGAGLGLLRQVVIDQHFAQRKRLSRLLTVVAQNPNVQGVGIDEDTALVVARGAGIEVIGSGAVTIIDGRSMLTNMGDIERRAVPEMIDVRLHLLPGGTRYRTGVRDGLEAPPAPLAEFIGILAAIEQ